MKKAMIILLLVAALSHAQTPATETGYSWDAAGQTYSPMTKTEYTYNQAGDIAEEILYGHNSSAWQLQSKDVNSYDTGNRITEMLRYTHDGSGWGQSEKTIYTRNSQGDITQMLWQEWDGSAWQNVRRTVYNYENGAVIRREHQNASGSDWTNSVKEEITPDGEKRPAYLEVYTWNGSAYQLSSRTITTWNSNGDMSAEHIDIYMGGLWEQFQKLERSYDSRNRLTIYLESFYSAQTGEWTPNMRSTNSYDDSNDNLMAIHFENYVNTGDPSTSWVPSWKSEYTYDAKTSVSSDSVIPAGFELDNNYPNPFNPTTSIAFSIPADARITIDVFNIRGEQVGILAQGFLQAGKHIRHFDASHLPSGSYFYRLQTDETTIVKKMLLIK